MKTSSWTYLLCVLLFAGCSGGSKSDARRAETQRDDRPAVSAIPEDVESATPDDDWTETEPPEPEPPAAVSDTAPRTGQRPRDEEAPMGRREPVDDAKFQTVRVFYATNRAATGSPLPARFYGSGHGNLSLGFCDVSIPANHQVGELESPKIWKLEFRENPEKHVVLLSVEPVDGQTYLSALRKTIADSVETRQVGGATASIGGEALIFVHGYNVRFEDAARRTAQIAYDLQFRGAPILYSWPSLGKAGLEAYKQDGRAAEWSQEHVMQFVTAVARDSGARKVHLIAHSMGNRIVAQALRRLADVRPAEQIPKFNEVILTAPDIDATTFKQSIAPRIIQTADRITIYASANDVALRASSIVNALGGVRLGQGGRDLTVFPSCPNINVVDASDVDTSLFAFRHSYHADSRTVLSDMRLVFAGRSVEERGLTPIIQQLAWKISTGPSRIGQAIDEIRR